MTLKWRPVTDNTNWCEVLLQEDPEHSLPYPVAWSFDNALTLLSRHGWTVVAALPRTNGTDVLLSRPAGNDLTNWYANIHELHTHD